MRLNNKAPFLVLLLCNFFGFVVCCAEDSPCHDSTWILSYEHKKCFKILDIFDTQVAALAACSNHNTNSPSTLLTVNSENEQKFIENLLFGDSNIVDNVWLGAKRETFSSEFQWPNGELIKNGYNNWADNNPTNTADRNCVELMSPIGRKLQKVPSMKNWYNVPCNKRSLAVCQTLFQADADPWDKLQELREETQILKNAVNLLKQNIVTDIKFDALEEASVYRAPGFSDKIGHVFTGVINFLGNNYFLDTAYRRKVQKRINDEWLDV